MAETYALAIHDAQLREILRLGSGVVYPPLPAPSYLRDRSLLQDASTFRNNLDPPVFNATRHMMTYK